MKHNYKYKNERTNRNRQIVKNSKNTKRNVFKIFLFN